MFRSRRGTAGHVGVVTEAQRHAGVYRVKVAGVRRAWRVPRNDVEGWWPKGARNRSLTAMRPLEA